MSIKTVRNSEHYAVVMNKLLELLKVIDDEAYRDSKGNPVGLWWYARHRRRDEPMPKNCRNEEDWSRRLRELLIAQKIEADCEKRYPTPPRRRCDLVIKWPNHRRLSLEVKGAWRHTDSKGTVRNPSYKKHLYAAGRDLDKVLSLDKSTADDVGLLLVGFDTSSQPIGEQDIAIVRARAIGDGWVEQHRRWNDVYRQDGRVCAWLWLAEAREA